jgi:hypothetical protein
VAAICAGRLGRRALGGEDHRAPGGAALDAGAACGGQGEVIHLGAEADQVRVLVVGVEDDQLARRLAAAARQRERAEQEKRTAHG